MHYIIDQVNNSINYVCMLQYTCRKGIADKCIWKCFIIIQCNTIPFKILTLVVTVSWICALFTCTLTHKDTHIHTHTCANTSHSHKHPSTHKFCMHSLCNLSNYDACVITNNYTSTDLAPNLGISLTVTQTLWTSCLTEHLLAQNNRLYKKKNQTCFLVSLSF